MAEPLDASSPEVEKLLEAVLQHALKSGASDVHIDPAPDESGLLRYRVDGVLTPAPFSLPAGSRAALLVKLKVLTGSMDLTERRRPQAGRIQASASGQPVDIHVEVLPTLHGEACVLRVLDRSSLRRGLEELGLLPDALEKLKALFAGSRKGPGLVLVCGLSKSGKTTTLYSLLEHLKRPDLKIVTVESPVECELEGVLQVPAGGGALDFATALSALRRSDPDVVMTGELGDAGTAELTLKTARSGPLVLSSFFTEDAPSALCRLLEMGLDPGLVSSALKAVLAQRLVRRLCPDCRRAVEPSLADVLVFKERAVPIPPGAKLHEPAGCASCANTGYRGRLGLHELLVLDEGVRGACLRGGPEAVRAAARKAGLRTLDQDGLRKALEGLTGVREVLDSAP